MSRNSCEYIASGDELEGNSSRDGKRIGKLRQGPEDCGSRYRKVRVKGVCVTKANAASPESRRRSWRNGRSIPRRQEKKQRNGRSTQDVLHADSGFWIS